LIGGVALALVLVALLAPPPIAGPAPQVRHIDVTARNFEFDPGTLYVNRGDTVLISLSSEDVMHGLYVDGYGVSAQAEPGQPGELRFVADREGAFHIRCSVPCGSLHPFMIGKLVVGPNLVWLRAVAASLITAVGALAVFWRA
jgi:heme/copper-type cytochrome/quinol oxidase subunit 2